MNQSSKSKKEHINKKNDPKYDEINVENGDIKVPKWYKIKLDTFWE